MSELEIVEVGPADDAPIAAWAQVVAASLHHELGEHATPWAAEELAVVVREPDRLRRDSFLLGMLDGEPVAAGWLAVRLLDNLDGAQLDVHVLPAHRRRGLGSQVLDRLEELAAAEGRTRLDARAQWPYDGPADGAGTAGMAFAARRGYEFGIGEVQRELPLPAPDDRLAALAADAAPHHAAYRIVSWTGPIPDDLVAGWLAVSSTLMTEAPAGEATREDESADVAAYRTAEALQAGQGRRPWHTVALDAAGEVVGYTQLMVPDHEPVFVHQWGTLVRRDHRGHRLGLALKVANLRALQAGLDTDGRRVVTWNAEVNGPMIAVNEAMGFVATARSAELQKIVAPRP
ncbi:GNAT family N-acetyltransferase [Nocardioides daeguensis]|uniref:GNAT family N-acetyltransferase n=1 Tax=Nocardioides daeguensis TaxID=908359 RepID=A0ABP6W5Z9_9ACTN|nr:GNAT family N-acetyltransferase [Nocardioides daeguensis]MBV6727633.1 GNAT family N-acetyltransferase [Nocardioides daeguensis]MCR1775105.1 GNAT family N-acetyltransferase [Nocardioides daeguensis]